MYFGGSGSQPSRRDSQSSSLLDVERAVGDVEGDPVAVAEERDRAAVDGLGGDVADAQARRTAGEAAVGDQQDVLAEAGALDRAGDREHLAHARAALRALVADHHDVAGGDRAGLERVHARRARRRRPAPCR